MKKIENEEILENVYGGAGILSTAIKGISTVLGLTASNGPKIMELIAGVLSATRSLLSPNSSLKIAGNSYS